MEYSIETSSILKQQFENSSLKIPLLFWGAYKQPLIWSHQPLLPPLLAAASTCQMQETAVGFHAMSVSNTVLQKEKDLSTAQKKG